MDSLTPTPPSPAPTKRRKSFLVLALLILPFLFVCFVILGGRKAVRDNSSVPLATRMGLNTELPVAHPDKRMATMDKAGYYQLADEDSIKKRELMQRDPYHSRIMNHPSLEKAPLPGEDPKAGEVLKKINELQRSINQQTTAIPTLVSPPYPSSNRLNQLIQAVQSAGHSDTPQADPQLDRLNTMLDKIIRIQQPPSKVSPDVEQATGRIDSADNAVASAGEPVAAIPAVVQEDQTLYTGATIAMRITDSVSVNGILLSPDQLVYGQVSINNDRMLIHINSIRSGHAIYPMALQVYDMDGLPGIHIPDMLSRDVAKQSADEGVNSMNIASFDPSLGAQAANAGIQAAKSLLSRKVRLVRVSIRSGYQVLLRSGNARTKVSEHKMASTGIAQDSCARPPGDLRPFLHHGCRNDKMELTLEGIYLQHDLLWMSLSVRNHSPIDYSPQFTRWYTRDKKVFKRTAVQEVSLPPVYSRIPANIPGDSVRTVLIGFRPFTLAKDKELVLQMGESNGGRLLSITLDHKEILKTRKI